MDFYFYFIVLSFLAGLFFVKRNSLLCYKLLLVNIGITTYNEGYCGFIKYHFMGKVYTLPYYNLYIVIHFVLLFLIFYCLIDRKYLNKFSVLCISILFIGVYVYELFTKEFGKMFFSITFMTGSIFTVLLALLYFYATYEDEKIMKPLQKPMMVSITAYFFYHLLSLPILSIFNYLIQTDSKLAHQQKDLASGMSFFLYPLIAYDFYLQWKQKK